VILNHAEIDMIIVDCLDLLFSLLNISLVSVERSKNLAVHGPVVMARNVGSIL